MTDASQRSWQKGKAAERWFKGWHEGKFNRQLIAPAQLNHSPWDYRDRATGKTYEVKYDEKAAQTGNICFELHGGERGATGLLISTSDFLVYIVPEGGKAVRLHYLRRMDVLRALFGSLEGGYILGRFVAVKWEGDALAHCWLVPEQIVIDHMQPMTYHAEVSNA